MSIRNQESKMMERMFKVSYEIKILRMSIANTNTHEVSTNNGQSQIRLTCNDFLYDVNKG